MIWYIMIQYIMIWFDSNIMNQLVGMFEQTSSNKNNCRHKKIFAV